MSEVDAGLRAHMVGEEALERILEDEYECCCSTCIVRVVLEAAWPILEEAAREEAKREQPDDR